MEVKAMQIIFDFLFLISDLREMKTSDNVI